MIMEVVPRDSHPISRSYEINLSIIEIRTVFQVREKLVMVYPSASSVLQCNAIIVVRKADLHVTNDDVSLVDSRDTAAEELCAFLVAEKGFVAAETQAWLVGEIEAAFGNDGQGICAGDCGT